MLRGLLFPVRCIRYCHFILFFIITTIEKCVELTNKGVNLCLKDIAQTQQQQKPESPTVTLTWPVSECKIPTRYIPPEMYSLRKGCTFPVAYDATGQGQHKTQACDIYIYLFISSGFSGQVGSVP